MANRSNSLAINNEEEQELKIKPLMSKLKTTHVLPNSNGGWDVKAGGSKKATKNFRLKSKATDRARRISKNKSGELFIHGKDGRIQNRDSHGNDPQNIKG